MKILGLAAILVLVILIILFIILIMNGLLSSVNITEKKVGPYMLVYSMHVGDYKKVGPVMDDLYNDLKDNFALETTKGFGLYYDNPKEVDSDELRSIVGCIVEGKSAEELSEVGKKYKIGEYPSSESVVAEFPFKGKLSIIIGVLKVYPKLSSYIKEKQYAKTPIMELYDQPNEKIEYIASVHIPGAIFDNLLE
ncbi:MAG: GyrI-like domain-containing protein [Candidatus Latescibacteria bacterium]|nr:GyrI-like domain-containing protein [Candidatus Latescibacterota bacterium]